jgi:hypothetical protein
MNRLPVRLDQVTNLAFRLDQADMKQQLLARLRRSHLPADDLDRLEHVEQDGGVAAAGVAKHIEGRTEQLVEGDRLDDKE